MLQILFLGRLNDARNTNAYCCNPSMHDDLPSIEMSTSISIAAPQIFALKAACAAYIQIYYYYYYYYYYMVGKPKARGHRAYTQGVCSHTYGAYSSLQPMDAITHRISNMNSLHRIGTRPRSGASCLSATQHLEGDVEGIMQKIPELGIALADKSRTCM